jgi:hypothetical protein
MPSLPLRDQLVEVWVVIEMRMNQHREGSKREGREDHEEKTEVDGNYDTTSSRM